MPNLQPKAQGIGLARAQVDVDGGEVARREEVEPSGAWCETWADALADIPERQLRIAKRLSMARRTVRAALGSRLRGAIRWLRWGGG